VRDNIDIYEAEAWEPPLIGRINALTGELGMGIYPPGTVHGTRAATHNNPVIGLQDICKADFMEKSVLSRDMPTTEDDKVGRSD
jgi:hypothetical protein